MIDIFFYFMANFVGSWFKGKNSKIKIIKF